MTALDRSIKLFANGHADQLTMAEQFTLGKAAGIIRRVHAAQTLAPDELAVVEAGLAALRRYHPGLMRDVEEEAAATARREGWDMADPDALARWVYGKDLEPDGQ